MYSKTLLAGLIALAAMPVSATVRYVAADGTGDGSSWSNAMSDLQAAIDASSAGDQIWVKAGTYAPTTLIKSSKSTSKAFIIKDGVSLYGGFNGTESSLSARSHGEKPYDMNNVTILSADDGVADEWQRQFDAGTTYRWTWQQASNQVTGTRNNYSHLIYSANTLTTTTVIDGFTLTGANANVATAKPSGGAIYAPGLAEVRNCRMIENSAYFTAEANDCNSYGGAVYLDGGKMTDCYIARTYCHSSYGNGVGGGVYAKNSEISNCVFEDCVSTDQGGGAYIQGGVLENCTFSGCYASSGGAVYNSNGTVKSVTITNCRGLFGGGVYNSGTLHNAIISGCYADATEYSDGGNIAGGGLYNNSGDASGIVCYNNTSYRGGGVAMIGGRLVNATVMNNALREGQTGEVNVAGATATNTLNSIYAADTALSNFVLPTTFSGCPETEERMALLASANWQLAPGSQFIDTGVVVNGFDSGTDPAGNPRMTGSSIDRGAYEFTGSSRIPTITLTFAEGTEAARLGIGGATGYEFTIDWGDGVEVSYDQQAYISHTITGNTVRVYGDEIIVLRAASQGIVGADLSRASALVQVQLGDNGLSSLQLGSHPAMTGLYAEQNQLTSLDVAGCPALRVLDVHENCIAGSIDCSAMSALSKVDVADNQLTSLILPKHSSLYEIDCSRNQISSLDVTGLSGLDELSATGNQLTSIDLTGLSAVTSLYLYENQLTSIDISPCSDLETISVADNRLTSLNISVCPSLKGVYVQNNNLSALDLSGNANVRWLNVNDNNISSLNVGNLTYLSILNAANNNLSAIDLSTHISLSSVNVSGNQLSEINVSSASYLSQFNVENNLLTTLDLSHNAYLYGLFCGGNALSSLDLSHNTYLQRLEAQNNNLTALNITANTGLQEILLQSNNLDASALGSLIAALPNVSGVVVTEETPFLRQLNISFMPGTADADVAAAEAKGWFVTADYDQTPEINPTSLNLQINRCGDQVIEVCAATIEYSNDEHTGLYLQDFMGSSARIVASIDEAGNVRIAPQVCGQTTDGDYLMIVNEESTDKGPYEIYSTYLNGHFDGETLTLEPWNMIIVPYTFNSNLGTYFPENVTSEFVMSNSTMSYTNSYGVERTLPLYAYCENSNVYIYGWGGYGAVTMSRSGNSWEISNDTACIIEGTSYNVSAADGGALLSTSQPDARTLTFGSWTLAPMTRAGALASGQATTLSFGFDLPTAVGVDTIDAADILSIRYFNLAGIPATEPYDGLNIVVTTYRDGRTVSERRMIRK